MIFTNTSLPGVMRIELEKRSDERGYFARSWCRREFEEEGLNADIVQMNFGFSPRAGTLRGVHWQDPPHAEVKIVRCLRGALYDVIVDIRPDSPTRGQWEAFELTAENGAAIYVPEGFAHGYQTLAGDTELAYMTTHEYAPVSARGVRYDDPALQIEWPLPISVISEQDRNWPDFRLTPRNLEKQLHTL